MISSPVTISAETPLSHAQKLMKEGNFRHLPVLKDGVPYSIVTDREISLVLGSSEEPEHLACKPISDFCAMDLVSVQSTTPLLTVLNEFVEKKIGAVVVVEQQAFVGIFSVIDACRILCEKITTESNSQI